MRGVSAADARAPETPSVVGEDDDDGDGALESAVRSRAERFSGSTGTSDASVSTRCGSRETLKSEAVLVVVGVEEDMSRVGKRAPAGNWPISVSAGSLAMTIEICTGSSQTLTAARRDELFAAPVPDTRDRQGPRAHFNRPPHCSRRLNTLINF